MTCTFNKGVPALILTLFHTLFPHLCNTCAKVDVICATMGGTLGSIGGFCVGDREVRRCGDGVGEVWGWGGAMEGDIASEYGCCMGDLEIRWCGVNVESSGGGVGDVAVSGFSVA